jgi:hypothetical protein
LHDNAGIYESTSTLAGLKYLTIAFQCHIITVNDIKRLRARRSPSGHAIIKQQRREHAKQRKDHAFLFTALLAVNARASRSGSLTFEYVNNALSDLVDLPSCGVRDIRQLQSVNHAFVNVPVPHDGPVLPNSVGDADTKVRW